MTNDTASTQLVVVGSSAGGIEALQTFVSTLPRDFPAPIVIAQHLDPKRPSHLGEILERRSTAPVKTVLDNEALAQGAVYVIPSDRNVVIADGHIKLQSDGDVRPKPSINRLFSSAAEAYGEALIAVILTGTGSDGAAGALEVKKAGGTVVIQNPATATYPSMPQSLAPTAVDFIANVEEIGQLLYDLLTGASAVTQASETKLLRTFLNDVHEFSGLDFTTYKPATILRRLKRRMVATNSPSLDGYLRYLERQPEEYQRLISTFLIKVTEFFRDRELFNTLRRETLPRLIEDARAGSKELRIWSAGCATGE
ncbi:MAG TPA: chemotaxis protein CheB, partial [Ktedonobacterales bacterium]